MNKIRLVIVDDSPLIRQILSDVLKEQPDIEVVGLAKDGQEAIELAKALKPDVMTLDVEMPNMNGLDALDTIMRQSPTRVLMVSSLTEKGSDTTLRALEAGAIDFVCKPQGGRIGAFRAAKDEIVEKIRAVAQARTRGAMPSISKAALPVRPSDKVIVVASSTGGPRALACFFEHLPKGLHSPMLIVQHMPAGFIDSFAKRLNSIGTMPCVAAKPGDKMVPGVAMIAPAGMHMEVKANGELVFIEGPTLHGVKPAADYLFQSAAKAFGAKTVGVVLTGMGRDGAEGALAIKKAGGTVFGESAETCTVYGMPRAAKMLDAVDLEVPIEQVAHVVVAALSSGVARAS